MGFELALEERERSSQVVTYLTMIFGVFGEPWAGAKVRRPVLGREIAKIFFALAAPAGDFEVERADDGYSHRGISSACSGS